MSWTYREIEDNWLAGSKLAAGPEAVVEAFDRADSVLGREWVDSFRTRSNGIVFTGIDPTLSVVTVGRQLATLEGVLNAQDLVEDLRQKRDHAFAELDAIYLVRVHNLDTEAELYPRVDAESGQRKSDFRVRKGNDFWTYVEVTQPDFSEAYTRINYLLGRITALAANIERSFALEVFLRREPTDQEMETVAALVPDFCELAGIQEEALPGELGFLILGTSEPRHVVLNRYPGEEECPRIGSARSIFGPNEPPRHVSVRMPFADERAEAIIRNEARQLPNDAPGLVMASMSRAIAGIISWEPIVLRRLQPTQHTRVSAVCLFQPVSQSTDRGQAWLPLTKFIINPHRKFPLPGWMVDALQNSHTRLLADLGIEDCSA
jgi:hypothetical protein